MASRFHGLLVGHSRAHVTAPAGPLQACRPFGRLLDLAGLGRRHMATTYPLTCLANLWWLLVLYAFMAAIFEMFREVEDEKIALEEKLETTARYRAFKTLLGEAMHEGDLMRQSLLLKPLQEWVDRTEAFVEDALDKPAALRFLDNSG